ncbi:MAG TPA: endonuclease/exonuclease/phosphatase family protein [Pyrinomonadaceae bacterium]
MATIERERAKTLGDAASEIEMGSFAPSNTDVSEFRTLVVASYNIRYCVGSHLISGSLCRRIGLKRPGRRPDLVSRHLEKAATALSDGERLPPPMILALQEADKETTRAGAHHIAHELARKLRMHYAYAASETPPGAEPKENEWYLDFEEHISATENGKTGVAILSRLPFAMVERVELPFAECAWRPRLALAATFQIAGRDVHLFNSHIDPHADTAGQLEQHEAVLARARELAGPVILLGDFNTLSKRSCLVVREFLESRGFHTPFPTGTATWRSGPIRLHTDWVFVRGASVKRFGVARRLSVSDHWPVWAEIDLNDQT